MDAVTEINRLMKFALYDKGDKCYLGGGTGPKTFDSVNVALAAATVATEQLGRTISAVPWTNKPVRLKDEVPVLRTPLQAIRRIERRAK